MTMGSRATIESLRADYLAKRVSHQLECIVGELDRVVAALDDPSDLEQLAEARDAAERVTLYSDWSALVLKGDERVMRVVACRRLVVRMCGAWGSLATNAELWAWVRRDVVAVRGDLATMAQGIGRARGKR